MTKYFVNKITQEGYKWRTVEYERENTNGKERERMKVKFISKMTKKSSPNMYKKCREKLVQAVAHGNSGEVYMSELGLEMISSCVVKLL